MESVLGVVIGRMLFSATRDRLGGPVALVWMKFPLVVVETASPGGKTKYCSLCFSPADETALPIRVSNHAATAGQQLIMVYKCGYTSDVSSIPSYGHYIHR